MRHFRQIVLEYLDYGQITLRYHVLDSLTIIVTADASSWDCDVASIIHANF